MDSFFDTGHKLSVNLSRSSLMYSEEVTKKLKLLEHHNKKTINAKCVNENIVSDILKINRDLDDYGPTSYLLLKPLARCAGNILSLTQDQKSVKLHADSLSQMLMQLLRKAHAPPIEEGVVLDVLEEIQLLAQCRASVRETLLNYLLLPLLVMVNCYHKLSTEGQLEVISTITCLLRGIHYSVRSKYRNMYMETLFELSKVLEVCGDFEVQQGIVEVLLRLSPTDERRLAADSLFGFNTQLVESFCYLGSKDFENECRIFLNILNQSAGDQASVVTLPCEAIFVDKKKVYKPTLDAFKHLYVNFNLVSQSLSVWCGLVENCYEQVFVRIKCIDVKNSYLLEVDHKMLQFTLILNKPLQSLADSSLADATKLYILFKMKYTHVIKLASQLFVDTIEMSQTVQNMIEPARSSNQRRTKVSEGVRLVRCDVAAAPPSEAVAHLSLADSMDPPRCTAEGSSSSEQDSAVQDNNTKVNKKPSPILGAARRRNRVPPRAPIDKSLLDESSQACSTQDSILVNYNIKTRSQTPKVAKTCQVSQQEKAAKTSEQMDSNSQACNTQESITVNSNIKTRSRTPKIAKTHQVSQQEEKVDDVEASETSAQEGKEQKKTEVVASPHVEDCTEMSKTLNKKSGDSIKDPAPVKSAQSCVEQGNESNTQMPKKRRGRPAKNKKCDTTMLPRASSQAEQNSDNAGANKRCDKEVTLTQILEHDQVDAAEELRQKKSCHNIFKEFINKVDLSTFSPHPNKSLHKSSQSQGPRNSRSLMPKTLTQVSDIESSDAELPHLSVHGSPSVASSTPGMKRRLYNPATPATATGTSDKPERDVRCSMHINQDIQLQNSLHIEINLPSLRSSSKYGSINSESEDACNFAQWKTNKNAVRIYQNKRNPQAVCVDYNKQQELRSASPEVNLCDVSKERNRTAVSTHDMQPKLFDSPLVAKTARKNKKQPKGKKNKPKVNKQTKAQGQKEQDELGNKSSNKNNTLQNTLFGLWDKNYFDALPDLVIEKTKKSNAPVKMAYPAFLGDISPSSPNNDYQDVAAASVPQTDDLQAASPAKKAKRRRRSNKIPIYKPRKSSIAAAKKAAIDKPTPSQESAAAFKADKLPCNAKSVVKSKAVETVTSQETVWEAPAVKKLNEDTTATQEQYMILESPSIASSSPAIIEPTQETGPAVSVFAKLPAVGKENTGGEIPASDVRAKPKTGGADKKNEEEQVVKPNKRMIHDHPDEVCEPKTKAANKSVVVKPKTAAKKDAMINDEPCEDELSEPKKKNMRSKNVVAKPKTKAANKDALVAKPKTKAANKEEIGSSVAKKRGMIYDDLWEDEVCEPKQPKIAAKKNTGKVQSKKEAAKTRQCNESDDTPCAVSSSDDNKGMRAAEVKMARPTRKCRVKQKPLVETSSSSMTSEEDKAGSARDADKVKSKRVRHRALLPSSKPDEPAPRMSSTALHELEGSDGCVVNKPALDFSLSPILEEPANGSDVEAMQTEAVTGQPAPDFSMLSPVSEEQNGSGFCSFGDSEPQQMEELQRLGLLKDKAKQDDSYLQQLVTIAQEWTENTAMDIITKRCEVIRRFMAMLELEAQQAEKRLEVLQELQKRQLRSLRFVSNTFTMFDEVLTQQLDSDLVIEKQCDRAHRKLAGVECNLESRFEQLMEDLASLQENHKHDDANKMLVYMKSKLTHLFM